MGRIGRKRKWPPSPIGPLLPEPIEILAVVPLGDSVKLLDRLGKAVIMSAETDHAEIIRRLFDWSGLPDEARKTAAYADLSECLRCSGRGIRFVSCESAGLVGLRASSGHSTRLERV